MQIEPAATLAQWAIDVDIAGETYTIPALPASEWLLAVLAGSWLDILPGLLSGEDGERIDELIVDGALTFDDLVGPARDALAAAAGTKWWTAARLGQAAVDSWVAHELQLRGLDPARMPLAAFLAGAYRAATRASDEAKRMQLDMELDRPPKGVAPEEWFDEAAAADSFLALAKGGTH